MRTKLMTKEFFFEKKQKLWKTVCLTTNYLPNYKASAFVVGGFCFVLINRLAWQNAERHPRVIYDDIQSNAASFTH